MKRLSGILLVILVLCVQTASASNLLPEGAWGGQGAAINANVDAKNMNLTFPCSFGQFPRPEIKANGSFTVMGWISSALVRPNNPKVIYVMTGHVANGVMTMSLKGINDPKASNYTLNFGKPTFFAECR